MHALIASLLLAFFGGYGAAWLIYKTRRNDEMDARKAENERLLAKLNHKRDEHGRFTK